MHWISYSYSLLQCYFYFKCTTFKGIANEETWPHFESKENWFWFVISLYHNGIASHLVYTLYGPCIQKIGHHSSLFYYQLRDNNWIDERIIKVNIFRFKKLFFNWFCTRFTPLILNIFFGHFFIFDPSSAIITISFQRASKKKAL